MMSRLSVGGRASFAFGGVGFEVFVGYFVEGFGVGCVEGDAWDGGFAQLMDGDCQDEMECLRCGCDDLTVPS